MTLTSTSTLVAVALLAIAALAALFYTWPRMPGSPAVKQLLRWLMIVGNQAVLVLLVGLLVNDAGGFYTSWADVFSSGSGPRVARVERVGHPPTESGVRRLPSVDPPGHGRWSARGRLESIAIDGLASGLHTRAEVFFPPQYFQPSYRHHRFDAIELIAGSGQSSSNLDADAASEEYHLIQARHVRPAVLVMLTSEPETGARLGCTDLPSGPQAETLFATDVPLALSRADRVTQTGWGVAGIGSGGYCAAKLGLLHYDVFPAAAAFDGTFRGSDTTAAVTTSSSAFPIGQLDDLLWRLAHMYAPPADLLLLHSNVASAHDAAQLQDAARAPTRITSAAVDAADPDANRAAMWTMLRWLGDRIGN